MAVNLQKGQKISLEKESGGELSKVIMGLGWDAKKSGGGFLGGMFGGGGGGNIDLDASCILFDESKNMVESIWFKQLKSKDGSIVHTGDNRTGDGDGDDEQIIVNLNNVPANIKSLIFTVNSFTGETFDRIENAFCRIVNASNNKEIAKYNLTCGGKQTAMIMAKVYRHNNEWKMHAIGEPANGRTFKDFLPTIVTYL